MEIRKNSLYHPMKKLFEMQMKPRRGVPEATPGGCLRNLLIQLN